MKIVLINQFVPPATAPTGILLQDLAEALRARGHEVTTVSSESRYGRATGLLSKFFEYVSFYLRAYRTLIQMYPPPDVVVSMTTPPFSGLIAARLKKKKRIPFILWCMDLYPEALAAGGLLRKDGFLYRLLFRLTLAERKEAACVVTLGPDMTRLRSGNSVLEIPVWSQLKFSPESEENARALRRERGWADDETICLYSGNMGRAHRIEEFAVLAAQLIPKVRFVFCGVGPSRKIWQERCGDSVEWLDPVDADLLTAHLLSADIHLISQQPEWVGVVVPSKYQAACALNRPVIFAGPSDSSVARWIQESGSGWILTPGDTHAIEQVAKEISNSQGVVAKYGHVLIGQFDREILVGKLIERIEKSGAHSA